VRVTKDWVYTRHGYLIDPYLLQSNSTNALAIPLTVSQNARRVITWGAPGIEPTWADADQVQSGAALPEGAQMRLYGVDGYIIMQPNDWAISTFFRVGVRLLHGVQSNFDGQLSIEAGYSMWEQTTPDDIQQWANAGFLREWYKAEQWSGAGTTGFAIRTQFVYPIRWRSNRGVKVGNDRALYLYMESDQNSREMIVWTRLRTLVGTNV